jgi:hypothetical protein
MALFQGRRLRWRPVLLFLLFSSPVSVQKIRGVNRGPERIIVDRTGEKGWYTGDHYRTFIPMGTK